jgi:hypothetical protein
MADNDLNDLEEHNEELREDPDVEEAVRGSFYDGDNRFYESGEKGEQADDQTIAPPG